MSFSGLGNTTFRNKTIIRKKTNAEKIWDKNLANLIRLTRNPFIRYPIIEFEYIKQFKT